MMSTVIAMADEFKGPEPCDNARLLHKSIMLYGFWFMKMLVSMNNLYYHILTPGLEP
jgi:hypothetical protein